LANITDIVKKDFKVQGTNYPFERDVAGRMMRTKNYTMQEGLSEARNREVYVIAADRDWWDRHRGSVPFLLLGVGFLLGLITDPIKDAIFSTTKPANPDTVSVKVLTLPQQEEPKNDQHGVQHILQTLKADSSKH
jgi:hypothetical protein